MSEEDINFEDIQYETVVWHGNIRYGSYEQCHWYGVGGLKHPLVEVAVQRIQEVCLGVPFDIYLVGGILGPWISWDVDIVITGEFDAKKVRSVLNKIVSIGFDLHLYLDVHFQKQVWGLNGDHLVERKFMVAELTDFFEKDGVRRNMSHYRRIGELFYRPVELPYSKAKQREEAGYKYSPPKLVVGRS